MGHAIATFAPRSHLDFLAFGGSIGVGFFFLLSGFVLMWTFDPALPARNFYGRRFARVYPLHAIMAVLGLGYAVRLSEFEPGPTVANFLLLQTWVPKEDWVFSLNEVSWTLCCEAFFYAMFPLIAGWALRTRQGRAALVIVACAATLVVVVSVAPFNPTVDLAMYSFPPFRIWSFVIGMLVAAAVRQGFRVRIPLPVALAFALASLAACGVWLFTSSPRGGGEVASQMDLLFLPAGALLLAAGATTDMSGKRSFLQARPLVLLGHASFALYLIHWLPLQALHRVIGTPDNPVVGAVLAAAFCLAAIGASVLVFRAIERPLEHVLRARLGTPRAVLEPAAGTRPDGQPA